MSNVSIVRCGTSDSKKFRDSFYESVELLGGIGKFIKKGERILIKPNLLGAHQPQDAVTTHPEFIRAAIRLIKEAGATPLIGDSPSTLRYNEVLEKTGTAKVAAEEKVEILNFLTYPSVTCGKIHLTKYVFDVDGIISLPKLKTHTLCTMTLAVKNLFGLVPGLTKTEYHMRHRTTKAFSEILADVLELVRSKLRLSIMDGITGMDGEGPANGRIREFGLILAGSDAPALDAVIYELFGIQPSRIPLVKLCREKNLGETLPSHITVTVGGNSFGLNNHKALEPFKVGKPVLPKTHIVNYIPELAAAGLASIVWIKPYIMPDKCKLCMKCVEICPAKAIKELSRGGKKFLRVNREKCISCFCCNEVCPHAAILIDESLPLKAVRKILDLVR